MIAIKEILKKDGFQGLINESEKWFLEHGYIYNDVVGWEKPEYLEMNGLDPNMMGIPSKMFDEYDIKEFKTQDRDTFGKKTGEFKIEYQQVATGKKRLGATENWFAYKRFKNKAYREWAAKKYGEGAMLEFDCEC